MKYVPVKTEEAVSVNVSEIANTRRKSLAPWKRRIVHALLIAIFVFVINISFYIYIRVTGQLDTSSDGGMWIIFIGKCQTAHTIGLWSHLTINILSSALLAAGNVCMQCLVAPTREEVDHAHASGLRLDIGVNTLRNIRHISKSRACVWGLLAISSVPLHLLYNSVLVEAKVANDYAIGVVSSDFLNGGPWSQERAAKFYGPNVTVVEFLQDSSSNLTRREKADCVKDYAPQFLSSWANLLLIVDNPLYTNETIVNLEISKADSIDPHKWMCDGPWGGAKICETPQTFTDPAKWQTLGVSQANLSCSNNWCTLRSPDALFDVEYCLAQPSPESCRIGASATLLLVVLACNLIKIFCFLWTILGYNSFPLVTLGDAIASFLRRPDSSTQGCGPLEYDSTDWQASNEDKSGRKWESDRMNGFRTASKKRWCTCTLLFAATWVTGLSLLNSGLEQYDAPKTTAEIVANGVGQLNLKLLVSTKISTLAGNVVLANTPQLVVSLVYLLYNDLFTRMHIATQWSRYSKKKQKPRLLAPVDSDTVSTSKATDRSQYILSLPLRISLPLLTLMTILHWLISQSIFLALVGVKDYSAGGTEPLDLGYPILGLAWSPFAIMLSLIVGALMILGVFTYALTIRLGDGIPVIRTCSIAISAACHPPSWDVDVAQQPISYGVVPFSEVSDKRGEMIEHVCLTSGPTQPLVSGRHYR